MNSKEIIAKIKAEIERLKDENNNIRCDSNKAYCQGYGDAFVDLLPFLSTLESKKPMQDGLEVEIEGMYQALFGTDIINRKEMLYLDTFEAIAHHFYELGCTRTAEKYDEIEYNRQRAEEQPIELVAIKPTLPAAPKPCIATFQEPSDSSETPKDLKEAANNYASVTDPEAHGIDFIREVFIAGVKWQKEQMISEAVEYEVGMHGEPIKITLDKYVQRARGIFPGDKVKIIIVKED